eukprot:CAMPEP_0170383522 /NCGR_PEP_ID=MMETSP0117_2-20130122/15518_1 /TAXON_ID=400756 /ORGANISM="Durinskia baltica, Strain CSIRO CS-38" /LENGTH=775 /DNA_ID=CAMNT_0010639227 /DNA_START=54 /DNA_END=2381 /DNA_ORIENTATION=+
MDLNVKVAVRCRPMSSKEIGKGCKNIISIANQSIVHIEAVDSQHENKYFTFDHCYGEDSLQETVYNDLGKPIVTQALDGFNGTIFAYGQTGSGKSFSMMGGDSIESKGIIPHLNEDLFEKMALKLEQIEEESKKQASNAKTKFMVTVSFLEVYNEEIKDLLNPSEKKLKIHENPKLGIYVEDLCELIVRDSGDLMKLIYQGNAVRKVAATKMNDQSSRSHSVFTIKVEQKTVTDLTSGVTREQIVKAKINLVDLAGSERAAKTGASGATLREGANINLSLMALGNVINMLSEGAARQGKRVIPYRDSKLTRLLQESLGGNARTIMIAAISPADYNYSETISTLKYAYRAKSIANAVTRNEDNNERMIRDLQSQIEELKRKLQSGGESGDHIVSDSELERKIKEMEANQLNAWEEKEKLSLALEAERQANMNNVISEMMDTVKDQKVLHMKNIKRLTNEKALLTNQFKESKENNSKLKGNLDENIQKYQEIQKQYDDLVVAEGEDNVQKAAEAEAMANQMIGLLTSIENDRVNYTEKRDNLKRMKLRLDAIDIEITDERAELLATSNFLTQNDKLREKIQEEEREKMKIEFEKELVEVRQNLDKERENVRETLTSEYQQERDRLKSEIKLLSSLLHAEEVKNLEIHARAVEAQKYTESLETRLVASEVDMEELQLKTKRLKGELATLKANHMEELDKEIKRREFIELSAIEGQNSADAFKLDLQRRVENSKYELFQQLMNVFEKERSTMENELTTVRNLLSLAAKVRWPFIPSISI